jgi:hypothetical protein
VFKKCVLTLALAFAVASVQAAVTKAAPAPVKKPVKVGLKVGMNLANTSGDDLSDLINFVEDTNLSKKARLGLCGGIFVILEAGPSLAIQPEVSYSMKGIKIDGPEGHGTVGVNYIDIPVLVKYQIPSKGNVKPAIFAGPMFSLKAGTSISATSADPADQAEADAWKEFLTGMADEGIKSTDVGLAFGTSLTVNKVYMDARYNLGLTNIVDDQGSDSGISVKNGVINVSVGILF